MRFGGLCHKPVIGGSCRDWCRLFFFYGRPTMVRRDGLFPSLPAPQAQLRDYAIVPGLFAAKYRARGGSRQGVGRMRSTGAHFPSRRRGPPSPGGTGAVSHTNPKRERGMFVIPLVSGLNSFSASPLCLQRLRGAERLRQASSGGRARKAIAKNLRRSGETLNERCGGQRSIAYASLRYFSTTSSSISMPSPGPVGMSM